ncbi:MAG: AraC family transcriptional regulator [Burkholderiales bacterium]|nr:AraC family transcriptional regulator [Burkholderiales bacterium]
MHLQVFPPDPKLAHLFMHILLVEPEPAGTHLPAGLSPSVMLFVRGAAQVEQGDGSLLSAYRFFLRGPYLTPMRVVYEPGTVALSVCFRPGMLPRGMGVSVGEIFSNYLPMQALLAPASVATFLAGIDAAHTRDEYVGLFQDFLLTQLDLSQKKSMGAAFMDAHQKLFFPLIDLALHFGIGRRQLERRVRDTYGVPLRDVRRIVRFGLSLPHILGQAAARGDLTRIAQDAGYYDQAHMHREYVEMAGISPLNLLQKIAGDDPAYWLYRLSQTDFRNLFLPVE